MQYCHNKLIKPLLVLFILSSSLFSQSQKNTKNQNNKSFPVEFKANDSKILKQNSSGLIPGERNECDYKIISSNSNYIELEFYPKFYPDKKINYNRQSFDYISFENAAVINPFLFGQPVIQSRILPIFVPSVDKNVITVVDFDERDINGVNLVPVPYYRFKNNFSNKLENIELIYIKGQNYYSQNKFSPGIVAELSAPFPVRDNLLVNIILNPIHYNPVNGLIKEYTRIRVKIVFGHPPVTVNRKRTTAEISLLKNAAINSSTAINWQNPNTSLDKGNHAVLNSVMNSGDWYRIEVKDDGSGSSDGIYKMTKSYLENAGINLDNIDPRTIKMYCNGGDMLDTGLNSPRPVDLQEIAIYVEGESGGHFDTNDYILFYGKSVNGWKCDSVKRNWYHYLNIYSRSNYYWLCLNTAGYGKRMSVIQSLNVPGAYAPSSFTEKIFNEPEVLNLQSESNVWLSQKLVNGQAIVWNTTLTGLENNSNILYNIITASHSLCPYSNYMLIKEDNSVMPDIYVPLACRGLDYDWISIGDTSFSINSSQKTNSEQSSFKMTFYSSDPAGEGYLEWMEILYLRRLNSVTGDFIRIVDTNKTIIDYNVSSFSSNQIKIFDASVYDNVNLISTPNISSGSIRFQVNQQNTVSSYFVIGQKGYKTPSGISQKIPNQNLHGITDGSDYIIISYSDFIPAAARLKSRREASGPGDPNYLKTIIVDVQQIYNEFSGGLLDPVAIRDFLKYSFENWQRKPSYVCFLGAGGYDYKNISTRGGNYVPVYEFSNPNINEVLDYTTDDFFVHLQGNSVIPLIPDLAYGRIPANSLDDANNYIDKIECYESGNFNNDWKDKIIFTADDGWTDNGFDGSQYNDMSEQLCNQLTPGSFEPEKVYLIAYPVIITSVGRKKPEANADLIQYWNDGSIAVSWFGHGNPDDWAYEQVFDRFEVIPQLNNLCKYPFVAVAACDFGKYDDPLNQSGAEQLTISNKKGSIGTLSATRPTIGVYNAIFIDEFWNHLFVQRDTLLLQNRIGAAVFQTKLDQYDLNSSRYVPLCDPTLRIQYPRFSSRVDSIEGLLNDTMRALSRIKIYGSIIHPDSSFWPDYDGKISLKIFDADRFVTMLDEVHDTFHFVSQGGIIFTGIQNIKNGNWSIEFIVPKDISYQNQNGKLINYFYNNSYDGSSIFKSFIVGGIDPNAPLDTTGPKITVYLNNPNFRSGDVVNENFTLMTDFFDESGINTTGTIGHKIEATINNDIRNKYDLTTYYNSDTSYQYGHLSYAFTGFSPGKYNLKLKAWDTYDNPSEASIDFTVSLSSSLQVMNVYNYPNPFKDKTVFTFQHNYPDAVNVKINIYTVSGRLIKVITRNNIPDKFVAIDWNGADQDGDKISNGVYIYKLTVAPTNGTNSVISTGKLAVLK